MPGLAGIINLKGLPVSPALYSQFTGDVLRSKTTVADEWIAPQNSAAITRIHRGIVNPAKQPAVSADERYRLFLDGEIFNEDMDLDRQAESILEAYQQEGEALFTRLNGSFAIILIDQEHHFFQIVADRLATVPVYYIRKDNMLAFSPDIRPLLRMFPGPPDINALAVENFLASGFILDGRTLIDGLYCIRPAEIIQVDGTEVSVKRYWQFGYTETRDNRSRADLEVEMAHLCKQAVRRQISGKHKLALPLSGGYDSRSILFFWQMLHPDEKIHTVCWGVDETIPETDAFISRELSKTYNTIHNFFPLEAGGLTEHFREFVLRDEGRTDTVGNYAKGLSVFDRIRDDVGIDMLVRGNEIFGARGKVYRMKDLMHTAFMDDLTCFPDSFHYLKPSIYKDFAAIGQEQMRQLHAINPYDDPVDRKDFMFILLRLSGYQSPLTRIKKQAIEERNPYLDNDIMTFMATLHSKYRIWKNLFMSSMRNQIPDFTEVEFMKRVSLIHWDGLLKTDARLQAFINHILFERRNGFDDILDQRKLRNWIKYCFSPKPLKRRSLVNRANRKIRKQFDQYSLEPSLEIFRLMLLKVWMDEFTNGEFNLKY
ncbi:hypothetical protein KKA00_03705 [bacterium]|nr:hypothetical protein [bacterium]MBU1651299.1 hypothetical protein [bacterium]